MRVGLVLWFCHSLLVLLLLYVSLNNTELGVLWVHMGHIDRPMSFLRDSFVEGYAKVVGITTYHTAFFLFHFLFGGLQFFFVGWLLVLLGKKLFGTTGPSNPTPGA
jgi:hypothetical protein